MTILVQIIYLLLASHSKDVELIWIRKTESGTYWIAVITIFFKGFYFTLQVSFILKT